MNLDWLGVSVTAEEGTAETLARRRAASAAAAAATSYLDEVPGAPSSAVLTD